MKTNNMNENDDIQIDLLELFSRLKRKLWLIILITFLTGVGTAAYSTYLIMPQYSSTAILYVLTKETTLTSLADLQIGSQLTKDYKIIVTSQPVLKEVVSLLKLDMSYKDLRKKISIDSPGDTRILSLTVQDSDPVRAKLIVNQIAMTASDYIGDLMEMEPPKIIEEGQVSTTKKSPDIKKNGILGAILGAFAACAILSIGAILDDSVCTEEDVERYLNLSVLAVVPNREHEIKKKTGFLKNPFKKEGM